MAITLFPALAMASARSPSSSGMRTTSAASSPWLVHRARSEAMPASVASWSLPRTLSPVSFSTKAHTRSMRWSVRWNRLTSMGAPTTLANSPTSLAARAAVLPFTVMTGLSASTRRAAAAASAASASGTVLSPSR